MPRTLLLHIGFHKCGSTTLQHYLAAHRDALEAQGVFYVKSGADAPGFKTHLKLAPSQSGHADLWRGVCQEVLAAPEDSVSVLSFEGLNRFDAATYRELLGPLFDAGVTVRILAYVRDHFSAIASNFVQSAKKGKKQDLTRFFEQETLKGNFFVAPKYADFSEVFGEENVAFRIFDRRRLYGNDIVRDVLMLLSWLRGQVIEKQPFQNQNVSIGVKTLAMVTELSMRLRQTGLIEDRRLARANARLVDEVGATLTGLFNDDPKLTIPADMVEPIMDTYFDDAAAFDRLIRSRGYFRRAMLNYKPRHETLRLRPKDVMDSHELNQARAVIESTLLVAGAAREHALSPHSAD
ncbi:MAG: hypothetical protein AAGF20_10725 [Pseudomonadota bacterium]